MTTPLLDAHVQCRADSRLAPNQADTSLQYNTVSHWLEANLKSALQRQTFISKESVASWLIVVLVGVVIVVEQ